MRRPDLRRRRLAALVIVAFALGLVATPGVAEAQTDDTGGDDQQLDTDQFGGYIASARGNALQITYDSPNLLPTGSPVVQFSIPEALSNLNSGPVGYSLASFLFPGPLIADLDAALSQGGMATGIPPYPIRAEAFFPAGPTSASDGAEGTEMVATTEFGDSRARSSYAGLSVAPVATIGAMDASSQTTIEGDQLVSRSRSEVGDIAVLGGLISIDSVTTDLVATSNGEQSATAGGTDVGTVSVLGLPVTFDGDGIRFSDPPAPDDDPGNGNPLGDVLGGLGLGEVGEQLDATLAETLNELLGQVEGTADEVLQQLFEATGIEVTKLESNEVVDGATASRSSAGLAITLNYDGQNTPLLTDLLELLPTDELPAENLGPVPFSPQAIAKLLERVHTISVVVGVGDVSASATPTFEVDLPPSTTPSSPPPTNAVSSPSSGGSGGGGGSGFGSATPDLPEPSGNSAVSTVPVGTDTPFPLGNAVPALAILGVVLGAPFFAAGSSRLADNALVATTNSCPEGLDRPPSERTGS